MNPFVERHQNKISGVLSCFDRVVITGTLPDIGYAGAMAGVGSVNRLCPGINIDGIHRYPFSPLATLQQRVFVPVTWAHPFKQPSAVKKRFKEIQTFQRNSPVKVNTPEELTTVIKQIRMLVFDADIPIRSAYVLVIDPQNIVIELSDQTEVVESGSRFKLLNLRA